MVYCVFGALHCKLKFSTAFKSGCQEHKDKLNVPTWVFCGAGRVVKFEGAASSAPSPPSSMSELPVSPQKRDKPYVSKPQSCRQNKNENCATSLPALILKKFLQANFCAPTLTKSRVYVFNNSTWQLTAHDPVWNLKKKIKEKEKENSNSSS